MCLIARVLAVVHRLCTAVISVMGPFNSPVGSVSRGLSLRFTNKQQTRSVGRGRGWERYVWRLVDSDIGTFVFLDASLIFTPLLLSFVLFATIFMLKTIPFLLFLRCRK